MKRAWMPLYIGDFIGNTMHLSAQEIGAYLLLIMHHWEHGSVPADSDKQRRICRIHPSRWHSVRGALQPFFDVTKTPGSWLHPRVLSELNRAIEISNKRKASAQQMHSKRSANAEQMHTHSHSHSQSKKKEERKMRATGRALALDWRPSDDLEEYGKSLGFSTPEIEAMAEDMRLWAAANSNRAIGRKADWDKTFQGWMRRKKGEHHGRLNGFNGHRGDKPTIQDALRAYEERLASDIERERTGNASHEGGASASRFIPVWRGG